ncbi:cysteine dioxygenase [Alistipes megaguti]|uniref:cysteine dioxygenase n=1 Tax=Alistipes megaguti TaxID=2364787 RepID=UPI002353044F|nr:cysteine dioxygenase [Alistipes megaguti]
MRPEETATLATRYHEACDTRTDYQSFFDRLLAIATDAPLSPTTGERIRDYVMPWLESHSLESFDRYSDRNYVRTYLGRSPRTHWEALVMSWKRGNATTIHGHPAFAGYHFADGVFRVEIFEPAGHGTARRIGEQIIDRRECLFAVGEPGRFDNHLHRITCLSETGHSLHVYSDDALQGQTFTETE